MRNLRTNFQMVLGVVLLTSLFISCKKEVKTTEGSANTFLRSSGGEDAEAHMFVGESNDGGLLAVGANGKTDKLYLSGVDKFGHTIWEKEHEYGSEKSLARGLKLADGSFLINHARSSYIMKIDQNGEIAYHKEFAPGLWEGYLMSDFVQSDNGNLYVSYSNGASSGSASGNYISEIEPTTGNRIQWIKYEDRDFGGKVLVFNVLKAKGSELLIVGSMFVHPWTGAWGDPWKTFVAKVDGGKVLDVKILDKDKPFKMDQFCAGVELRDEGMVFASARQSWLFARGDNPRVESTFDLYKYDKNLNQVWVKNINVGVASLAIYDILEEADGSFFLVGTGVKYNTNNVNGIVLRLDADGNVKDSKLFVLGEESLFVNAHIMKDQSYLLGGGVGGFGKDKEQTQQLLLKLDRELKF